MSDNELIDFIAGIARLLHVDAQGFRNLMYDIANKLEEREVKE